MMSRAFDLALFVDQPAAVGDGAVVSAMGPPFTAHFAPLVVGRVPGIVVGSSVPAATAQGQSLLSGAGPAFAWSVVTDPAASATVPPSTAVNQVLMSDGTPSWQITTAAGLTATGGACMLSSGGTFSAAAKLTFATTATPTTCIDGGDPNFSVFDNFSWDAGQF